MATHQGVPSRRQLPDIEFPPDLLEQILGILKVASGNIEYKEGLFIELDLQLCLDVTQGLQREIYMDINLAQEMGNNAVSLTLLVDNVVALLFLVDAVNWIDELLDDVAPVGLHNFELWMQTLHPYESHMGGTEQAADTEEHVPLESATTSEAE